ncbi:serine/threonine-protein kinase PCRK2-like [Rhododendron vialii]|uniref:serine/threonine-protein kinase PCRK2-like n=1 Tax=Rhododendron vialii TaxID=182163 RepID=UPI00265F446C|nr:serine/threonine-protein kinase PCRK2-like [Rhododendron vialii]
MDCLQIATVDEDGAVPRPNAASKVLWVSRSLSVASSSSQRRANDLRVFTFGELEAATGGFSRGMMIGEGEFGCVYRGVVRVSDFDDGNWSGLNMDVAVKQLDLNGFQGHKEWINEVNILGVVKHPNLVKLVGYCAEDDETGIRRLLVYEFMHNKSLEDHLFIREVSPLSWMARLRIAQDAARGLAHLHEEMDFQIIFLDLKTSDILLDENFNAKLSDFGQARQGPAAGLSHISTSSVVRPTRYAAPEYIQTGRLSARSDVWSFGVVLYELITGRRAVEKNMPCNEQKLLDWVRPYVSDSRKFHLIVDPRLGGQYCIKSAKNLAALANKCLAKNAKSRPKMSEVVEMLGKIIRETSSENDSAPQHAKETQGKETIGKKEETKKSIWKFNWCRIWD